MGRTGNDMKKTAELALEAAQEIKTQRYPDAECLLVAGSIMRGEETPYSDIDLVVVYKELPHARRESFLHAGFPVEAFIHDPKTLEYFFSKVDGPSGCPSLPRMVQEGTPIPDVPLAREVKDLAQNFLDKGPPAYSDKDLKNKRYMLGDLMDDLREPRSHQEAVATAVQMYEMLPDFFLRAQGLWSAKGKHIPRRLRTADPYLADRFENAMAAVFTEGHTDALVQIATEILAPYGGPYFDGHSMEAPKEWRF